MAKNNGSNNGSRTLLIVVCILVGILMLLILPATCSRRHHSHGVKYQQPTVSKQKSSVSNTHATVGNAEDSTLYVSELPSTADPTSLSVSPTNNRFEDDTKYKDGTKEGQSNPRSVRIDNDDGKLVIMVVTLSILLVFYIVARIKSKKGTLVLTATRFDEILIILSPVLFFVVWLIGFDHEITQMQVILLVISGLAFIGSIIYSIIYNSGHVLNIIISVIAKVFIFVFTIIILFILIFWLVLSLMRAITNHNDTDGTYIVKYDHFLNRWVGYRID